MRQWGGTQDLDQQRGLVFERRKPWSRRKMHGEWELIEMVPFVSIAKLASDSGPVDQVTVPRHKMLVRQEVGLSPDEIASKWRDVEDQPEQS